MFVSLTEHNDNEGESWSFWFPFETNREFIDWLLPKLWDMEDVYEFNDKEKSESKVDAICEAAEESGDGYMPRHIKLDLTFKPQPELEKVVDNDGQPFYSDLFDKLYKGGLERYKEFWTS